MVLTRIKLLFITFVRDLKLNRTPKNLPQPPWKTRLGGGGGGFQPYDNLIVDPPSSSSFLEANSSIILSSLLLPDRSENGPGQLQGNCGPTDCLPKVGNLVVIADRVTVTIQK